MHAAQQNTDELAEFAARHPGPETTAAAKGDMEPPLSEEKLNLRFLGALSRATQDEHVVAVAEQMADQAAHDQD